jgi:hypothetical protein
MTFGYSRHFTPVIGPQHNITPIAVEHGAYRFEEVFWQIGSGLLEFKADVLGLVKELVQALQAHKLVSEKFFGFG